MKVYIRAPWEDKRHGPYDAVEAADYPRHLFVCVQEAETFPVLKSWTEPAEPAEPKYPPVGVPVEIPMGREWTLAVYDGDRYTNGIDGFYCVSGWRYPEPPWSLAPDDAVAYVWLSDGTTDWSCIDGVKAGAYWGLKIIVHVAKRPE